MPPVHRVSDNGKVDKDAHGCPACPHTAVGPMIAGSPDVFVNSLPAGREGDPGIHAPCCGPNMWKATKGSGTVFVNGKAIHRKDDDHQHCGGKGKSIVGSANVNAGG